MNPDALPTRVVPSPRVSGRRIYLASAVLIGIVAWALWSYSSGGLVRVLLVPPAGPVAGPMTGPGAGTVPEASPGAPGTPLGAGSTLEAVRAYVLGYGVWAPIVYVASVTVEVLIAPIPGTLLYAPAGAIFGGFVGGTLSLIGNVGGAAIACWLAATFGAGRFGRHGQSAQFARIRARLQSRGAWVIFLLRLNPLTSSDLVSYAAGLADIRVRHVALGTLFGMIPQCYLQAYLAQTLFEALPSGPWVVIGGCLLAVLAAIILWRVVSGGSTSSPDETGLDPLGSQTDR